jgi:hypothetical protein
LSAEQSQTIVDDKLSAGVLAEGHVDAVTVLA